ncbi:MAG: ATPase domain-containing protein [Candidatus Devosia phytovorans]|uniref:non-specific serine/threonine protein kinase n=1 Tax=Candidatus Devosia phytovorans TaxID=3121372 RepID=A0AAJ6B082_9HYPH|nr:ATPase domain-containing protein [Devosia sp.]WEK03248.1 MAG: ATPase domain-containing protein [Devosia sp.]
MSSDPRISTGNDGLDIVLNGGLTPSRLYLLEGAPGSGKTTLSLQFLMEGVAKGEPCLYITLSETREELSAVVASHGWTLNGIDIFELSEAEDVLGDGRGQTIIHPWEIELSATVDLIIKMVEKVKPKRLVFDSLSELRLLSQDPLRYRRQVLSLKQYFAGQNITVLLVDDLTGEHGQLDAHLHSIAHGVITLERKTLEFGPARRVIQVQKMRGVQFSAGYHDVQIERGGLKVYPRLIASDHHTPFVGDPISSGIAELDASLSGGPLRGTCSILTGPPGAGKSSVALSYALAACERGENATVYEFDERIGTMLARSKSLGQDPDGPLQQGCLKIVQMDPAETTPGQFAWLVRKEVEERQVKVLVIDSLNGYLAAMPEEKQLLLQLHELLSYLNQQGVMTLLVNPQTGLVGTMNTGQLNISYIADVVFLFRYFEAQGRLHKAISIMKNRSGAHEDAIRELKFDSHGIRIGDPLVAFRGVLTGTPEYVGERGPLMESRADDME